MEQIHQHTQDNRRIIIDKITTEMSIGGGKKRFKYGITENIFKKRVNV
jgi:hypothetical protein